VKLISWLLIFRLDRPSWNWKGQTAGQDQPATRKARKEYVCGKSILNSLLSKVDDSSLVQDCITTRRVRFDEVKTKYIPIEEKQNVSLVTLSSIITIAMTHLLFQIEIVGKRWLTFHLNTVIAITCWPTFKVTTVVEWFDNYNYRWVIFFKRWLEVHRSWNCDTGVLRSWKWRNWHVSANQNNLMHLYSINQNIKCIIFISQVVWCW